MQRIQFNTYRGFCVVQVQSSEINFKFRFLKLFRFLKCEIGSISSSFQFSKAQRCSAFSHRLSPLPTACSLLSFCCQGAGRKSIGFALAYIFSRPTNLRKYVRKATSEVPVVLFAFISGLSSIPARCFTVSDRSWQSQHLVQPPSEMKIW